MNIYILRQSYSLVNQIEQTNDNLKQNFTHIFKEKEKEKEKDSFSKTIQIYLLFKLKRNISF